MTTNRRDFLHQLGLGAAGVTLLPDLTFAQERSPNERIRIGVIGVGGQGRGNLRAHVKNTVAVCDVDKKRLDEAQATVEKATGKKCAAYGDYRKLLDDKNVDAVIISTPDRGTQHDGPRLRGGQGRVLREAAVADGRRGPRDGEGGAAEQADRADRQPAALRRPVSTSVRTGPQRPHRQGPHRQGRPRRRQLWRPARRGSIRRPSWTTISGKLRPALKQPYNAKRTPLQFRFFWDYSGGQMTNWGAHHLDIAQWGLGMDDSGPVSIAAKARFHAKKWYEVPERLRGDLPVHQQGKDGVRDGRPAGDHVRGREGDDLRHPRQDRGVGRGVTEDAARPQGDPPLRQPQPPRQLAGVHQDAEIADL
ncbi:MAG: Gfo/Idh/MocA family oxidoreductase [Gemmataceae bacterium]